MSFQTDLYDDILTNIIVLTNRPDLEAETELALKTATLSVHHAEMFPRDMATQLVQLPNGSYQTQLSIPALFPRFRSIVAMQPTDVNFNVLTQKEYDIEVIEFEDIYDEDGVIRNNVAYVAGSSLNVRTRALAYGYNVSWMTSPSVNRNQYDSWIAQLYPAAVIYWGASIVLTTNGNEDKANKYMKMVEEVHLPHLRNNYLLGKAR